MRITQEQYRSSGICADRVHPSERGLPGESADFLPGKREATEGGEKKKQAEYLKKMMTQIVTLGFKPVSSLHYTFLITCKVSFPILYSLCFVL